jgi:hypothetical protein
MKKSSMIYRSVWAAAVLLAATTMMTVFTACAEKDLPGPSPQSQMKQELVGTWFGTYPQQETLTKYGLKHHIVKAEQALTFNADGTGTCSKILTNAANEPITLFGGSKNTRNGRFHYTVGNDSVITITRDGDGDASNPKTWKLRFGIEGLTGTDGITPYELRSADEKWQAYIASQEELFNKTTGKFSAESNPSFLTDWQNCEDVYLEGIAERQYTPWAGFSYSDIGDHLRFDVQKEAGWEMAFCQLNDPQNKNARLFGLYNRYTGILRVFSYVLDPGQQGYGREMGYKFMTDGTNNLPRYSFYNSMEYAIPICHDYNNANTFDKGVILKTGETPYKPFEVMISAYTTHTKPTGVTAGWHCTDYDFSGFTERCINWAGDNPEEIKKDKRTLLTITPYTTDEEEVLLTGSILGNLKGEFTDPEVHKEVTGTTLSTITQLVGTLAGGYSGLFSALGSGYGMQNACKNLRGVPGQGAIGAQLIGGLSIGALVASGVGTIVKIVDQFAGKPNEKVTVTPGKIDMAINAKVDLSGTISRWNSINDAGLRITPELLSTTKPSKNEIDSMWFGSGCFGLAEDPVIYISKEDLLTVKDRINITKKGGSIESALFRNDSVRLVSFLDPRSVKVCLNTDLYHGIDSVHVLINYGVDLNRPVGNTDCYRQMLKLDERPTFSIMPTKGGDQLSFMTTPKLHVMRKAEVLKNDFYTENAPDSVKLDHQLYTAHNDSLPIYGRVHRVADKRIVMDPQVFVPFRHEENSSTVYDAIAPDFLVTVTVAFRCEEVPDGVFFSQVYIPKIELIGHNDLATFYDELKKYSDKSLNNQAVGTVFNASNIKVYDHSGEAFLGKTLNILNKCK